MYDLEKSNDTQALGTQDTLKLGHLGTPALEALQHSQDTCVLGHLRHLGSWTLRHLGTRALERHLGTQEFRYSGTWAIEALYLADCRN